jgi:hypothetical protein
MALAARAAVQLSTMNDRLPPSSHVAKSRQALLSLAASFGFTWGFVALGVAGLATLGMDYHESEKGLMLLAFVVFLTLFLWAFASARPARALVLLGAGAAGMTAAAWALQRAVLA